MLLISMWAALLIVFMVARPAPDSPLFWLLFGSAMLCGALYMRASHRDSRQTQRAIGDHQRYVQHTVFVHHTVANRRDRRRVRSQQHGVGAPSSAGAHAHRHRALIFQAHIVERRADGDAGIIGGDRRPERAAPSDGAITAQESVRAASGGRSIGRRAERAARRTAPPFALLLRSSCKNRYLRLLRSLTGSHRRNLRHRIRPRR